MSDRCEPSANHSMGAWGEGYVAALSAVRDREVGL
jgi:hypothetical protein